MNRATFFGKTSAPRITRGRLLSATVRRHGFLLAILGLAALLNLPTLDAYFHGDDFVAFADLTTKSPLNFLRDAIVFQDSNPYWRPLGEVYYLAVYQLAGLDAVAFHIANLSVFLVTIALLYLVCVRAGFERAVAIGAAGILGIFPNHVVSVAWVTNGPRLLAVMFGLLSLLALQQGIISGRRLLFDALAFFAFLLAALSDEIFLPLAPLAVLYGLIYDRTDGWKWRTCWRAAAYGAVLLALVPVQILFGMKDDPQFDALRLGGHMLNHYWGLTAKLVLPISDGVAFASIAASQWVAGAIAIAAGAVLLLTGSARMRFLILWTVLGLAPFSLWQVDITPARYVYVAAVPFSIIAAWCTVSAARWVSSRGAWTRASRYGLAPVAAVLGVLAVFLVASLSSTATLARNDAWARATEPYRALAENLPAAVPHIPSGGRLVIYNAVWPGYAMWPEAVVRTVYRDRSISVVTVDKTQIESTELKRRPKDVVVFYTAKKFIAAAPLRSATSGQ